MSMAYQDSGNNPLEINAEFKKYCQLNKSDHATANAVAKTFMDRLSLLSFRLTTQDRNLLMACVSIKEVCCVMS